MVLVFDGRIDNRDELIPQLSDFRVTTSSSDAHLVLASYKRWGRDCAYRLLGPFALAVCDLRNHRVMLCRDPLGERGLFLALSSDRLVAASEPAALLAYPGVSEALDEETMARFFSIDGPAPGRTFFRDISEVRGGESLLVREQDERNDWFWRPQDLSTLRLDRQEDYEENYRELLTRSVRACMRTRHQPGIMMSGGLDSTTIAAIAARELRQRGAGRLRAFSWVFDELAQCDERRWMDQVRDLYDLETYRVVGDEAWPMSGMNGLSWNASSPFRGPFRELRDRLLDQAKESGVRVLLSGEGADDLFTGAGGWLADLIAERRFGSVLVETSRGLAHRYLLGRRWSSGLRTGWRAVVSGARDSLDLKPLPWLTPAAERTVLNSYQRDRAKKLPGHGRQRQLDNVLSARTAMAMQADRAECARRQVELRFPYASLRLVEFLLTIPSHQLFRPGWHKWLSRRATAGLLPRAVRWRRVPSSLNPLYVRGMAEGASRMMRDLFHGMERLWPRYVRREWLGRAIEDEDSPGGRPALVLWYTLSAELWSGAARSNGSARIKAERTAREEVGV